MPISCTEGTGAVDKVTEQRDMIDYFVEGLKRGVATARAESSVDLQANILNGLENPSFTAITDESAGEAPGHLAAFEE